jgi:branched-subunit amino acid transport protein
VIEIFYALVIGALLVFHAAMALRWERERARLLAAIVAPAPAAAVRALTIETATQPAEAKLRPVPVGAE